MLKPNPLAAAEAALVDRIARRDHSAFETLMRQHNGRLFRVARAILKDDAEAEDALQDAYLDAFRHLSQFRGDSQLGTWLGRIVANHALMRLRRQKRDPVVVPFEPRSQSPRPDAMEVADQSIESPPDTALRAE